MSRERGVSIVEMVIAMAVAMLIMSSAYFLYRENRAFLERPRASYNVQEELMGAARWLQRDLNETNLVSVQMFPNQRDAAEPPGLSLLSPRTLGEDKLVMSEYGGVRWQKYVYYTLEPVDAVTGNLVRKEGPLGDQPSPLDAGHRIPMLSGKKPSEGGDPNTRRVVARYVVLPNVTIENVVAPDPAGGFKITFQVSNGTSAPNIGGAMLESPIQADLSVYELSPSTGKPSALRARLVVMPRN